MAARRMFSPQVGQIALNKVHLSGQAGGMVCRRFSSSNARGVRPEAKGWLDHGIMKASWACNA